MLLRDRPLSPELDEATLVERDEHARLLNAVTGERNVLILGEGGSGKSTTLNWLRHELQRRGGRVARVDAAAVGRDVLELLDGVRSELVAAFNDDPVARDRLTMPGTVPPDASRGVRLVAEVRRLRVPENAYVLLDGMIDRETAFELFGRLRDELWALNLVWVVAARPQDAGPLRRPPADAFFAVVIDLSTLSDREVRAMSERVLRGVDRQTIDPHALPTVDTPRTVRGMLRWLEARLEHGQTDAPPPAFVRQERAARLGRPASMLVAELEARGEPVTAQDIELQRSLGWTRAHLQRWLARLEEEGLVRSFPDRQVGQGRPRKLFELVEGPGA